MSLLTAGRRVEQGAERPWRPAAAAFAGRRPQALAALTIYLAGAALLLGSAVVHGRSQCLCVHTTTDEGIFTWGFEWWPHALLHGLNPFYTHLLYAPFGANLAHGTFVPGAALLLAPVTAAFGPLLAFNLAMFLCPVLAAFFTFLLCRRLTGSYPASLVGGWLFGFSSYMFGQLTGHLNLTLVFLVPAVIHLVIRGLSGELRGLRLGLLLVAALVLQFLFSLEVFASMITFGVLALLVAYVMGGQKERVALRNLAPSLGLSLLVAAIVLSPYLYYALKPGMEPILTWRTGKFSDDLLAYVVPGPYTAVGGWSFLDITNRFTAWAVEGGAYLGIPMLVMMGLALVRLRRHTGVRVMLAALLITFVCSLGAKLHAAGPTGFPLPWGLVHRLPVLGEMLPSRFGMYVALIGSVLVAMWLASRPFRVWPWLVAALAVVSLWPAIGRNYWRSRPELPRFFTTSAYRRAIHRRDIVLVLPVGIFGQSMLWNAETHLGFTMAGGYVTPPEAPDPYKRYAIYPQLAYFANVPDAVAATRTFLAATAVTVVVLDPGAAATTTWVPNLERLGWSPRRMDGVVVLRHTGYLLPPTQPLPPPASPRAAGPAGAQRPARELVASYLRALGENAPERACRLLSPAAADALAQRRDATALQCAGTLARTLRSSPRLRGYFRTAKAGPATIAGGYGYVAIVTAGTVNATFLPVRRIGSRWRVNGQAASAR